MGKSEILSKVWAGEINYDDWLRKQEDVYKQGQLSCAAGPWVYRTDTGDEHGKVMEDAELPKKDGETEPHYIFKLKAGYHSWVYALFYVVNRLGNLYFYSADLEYSDDYLKGIVIAWAEVRR